MRACARRKNLSEMGWSAVTSAMHGILINITWLTLLRYRADGMATPVFEFMRLWCVTSMLDKMVEKAFYFPFADYIDKHACMHTFVDPLLPRIHNRGSTLTTRKSCLSPKSACACLATKINWCNRYVYIRLHTFNLVVPVRVEMIFNCSVQQGFLHDNETHPWAVSLTYKN